MVLTKAVLSDHLYDELGFNKQEAKDFIDMFFEEMRKTLENGNEIKISGFGNFKLRDKNERPGRNPRTGEVIPVSARRVVTFKVGQKLKYRIDEYSKTLSEE